MNLSGRPTDNPKYHMVGVRLDAETYNDFSNYCSNNGLTPSEGMRNLIASGLKSVSEKISE